MQTEAVTFLSGVVGLQLARYKATVNYWNELCKLNSSRCSVRFGKPAEFILETFLRRLTLLYPLGEVLLLLLPLMFD